MFNNTKTAKYTTTADKITTNVIIVCSPTSETRYAKTPQHTADINGLINTFPIDGTTPVYLINAIKFAIINNTRLNLRGDI